MKKLLLPILGVIWLTFFAMSMSFAQQNGVIRCATMENDAALRANNPNLGTLQDMEDMLAPIIKQKKAGGENLHIVNGVYIIPVVFHIVHNGEAVGTGSNIAYNLIQSQIETLNDDFRRRAGTNGFNTHPAGADTQIEFRLAQRKPDGTGFGAEIGVNRIDRNTAGFTAPPYTTAYINSTIKPYTTVTQGYDGSVYMSYWSVQISGGILGYAQFPTTTLSGMDCTAQSTTTDGVVMASNTVGGQSVPSSGAPYNLGRTATHEIGHWLGLRHIWGDTGGCAVDDFCADTPNAAAANFGCANTTNSCTDTPVDARDMVENYMDYSDDACMNIFTNDQKIRMRTILETFRFSLINSIAAVPPNADDAGVLAVLKPVGDACSSTVTPSIRVKNYGTNALTSVTIEYRIDGAAFTSQAFTGLNVATNGTVDLILNNITGVALGSHTFEARSILPNGVADPFTASDLSNSTFTLGNGTLPILADFEGASFPPTSWERQNPGNDCNLWVADGTPTLVGSNGSRTKAGLVRHHTYTGAGQEDILISPSIDLTDAGLASAGIEFDLAYRRRNTTISETLRIEVSTDCGATWLPTAIYSKTGDALATVTPSSTAAFLPTAANQWRRESASLNAYLGQSIKIRFVTTNANGNNLWIDNVKIYDARPEVQFATTATTITENSTSGTIDCRGYQDLSIPVNITLAPPSAVTVNVAVTAGTMTNTQDYTLQTPTLTFAAGATTAQNVVVRVFNDDALEVAENLQLTLSVVGTDAILGANTVHTLTVNDNDDVTQNVTQTLFEENFETQTAGVVSNGWTVTSAVATPGVNTWVFGENGGITGTRSAYITNNTTTRLLAYTNTSISRTRLVSPAINTVDATNLQLSFDFKSNGESGTTTVWDYGRLMYSTNPAGPYTNITGPTDATGNGTITNAAPFFGKTTSTAYTVTLPAACQNQATLYIVWRWDNDDSFGTNPPFAIDNIVLTGSKLQQYPVEDAIVSEEVYLGPNSTVYVISAANKVMAKLENTTAHDYGCTTVAIDRVGTGQAAYTSAGAVNGLTQKSFRITPTNVSAQNIGVTLYYTDAEKTGWETETGLSWTTDAKMQRTGGAISAITPTTQTANGATNTAHAITTSPYLTTEHAVAATINNGFGNGNASGGFAIGDPRECDITDIAYVSQTACNNDRYTATVTVTYTNPSGSLVVNGQTFATTTSPQTVTLFNLVADGNTLDVTASFSASCTFTSVGLITAPAACGITPGGGGAPITVDTPTRFTAIGVSTSQINLSWTAVNGATGYLLYRGNTLISTIPSGATTSFEHTDLDADTFYSYRLIALKGTVQSQPAQANGRTFPNAPTIVSTTPSCGTGSVKLVLNGSGSVFNIYLEETGGMAIAQTANANYLTPVISQTTVYYVSVIGQRGLESARTRVEAVVNPLIEATIAEGTFVRSCDATTTLTANSVEDATYQWLLNGVVIDGATTNSFAAIRSGNYQVRTTKANCSTTSSFTRVVLNYAPTAEISNGTTANFCENGTLRAREASNATYSWTLNNTVIGSEREVSVSESGEYTLTVTEDGCSATDLVQVVVTKLPTVSVEASAATFCPNGEVTIKADSISGVTYEWSRNGRVIRRNAESTITVNTSGEYSVSISQNGCSVSSASVRVDRLSLEPAYLRTTETTLFVESVSAISNIVWKVGDADDTSLNGQVTVTPTESAYYSALVTYENGCTIRTRTVFFTFTPEVVTGEEQEFIKALRIYPNPSASGIFQIDLGQNTETITLTLTDQLGRVLETIALPLESNSYQLDLSKYASALYTIQFKSEKGVITRKVVIDK